MNGAVCAAHGVSGIQDSYLIDIVKSRGIHKCLENFSEIRLTDAAGISQVLNPDWGLIMAADVIKCRFDLAYILHIQRLTAG